MENVKKVTGRVGDTEISRYIYNYLPEYPEEILTTRREICDMFENLKYDRNMVVFDND